MKMICPECGSLNPEATISWSGNVLIIQIGANTERGRSGCGVNTDKLTI